MEKAKDRPISADDLSGYKKLRRVRKLLAHLHWVGCGRDKAGNRRLYFDDYVVLILLYLFNPLIDSLRTLAAVASLPEVQQRLGIKRFSLGSFSESQVGSAPGPRVAHCAATRTPSPGADLRRFAPKTP